MPTLGDGKYEPLPFSPSEVVLSNGLRAKYLRNVYRSCCPGALMLRRTPLARVSFFIC